METIKPIHALEIVMSWEGTPLAQELIDSATPITLGEEAMFLLPTEAVPGRITLADVEHGRWIVRPLPGVTLVATKDGMPLAIDGRTALEPGMELEAQVGDFRFFLRATEAPEATPRAGVAVDRSVLRFVGASFLFHMILIAMFLLVPPNASALNADLSGSQAQYLRVQLDAVAQMQVEPEQNTSGMEGPGGEATASPEGGDGEPGPAENTGRSQRRRGDQPNGRPTVTADTVSALGTLEGIRTLAANLTEGVDGSPWGSADDNGLSWTMARGPLGGDGIFGGLNLNSTGVGTCEGPRCGEGVARVGDITGPGGIPRGPRGDEVNLRDREPGGVPHVRPGGRVTTTGGLSREQVQRVVRRHKPEVRFCYEQALVSRPDLEGRVSVRFVVQPPGTVSVAVAQNDSVSPRVASCVTESVERWTFPPTEGVTAVTYPFVFSTH